jgi:putative protease
MQRAASFGRVVTGNLGLLGRALDTEAVVESDWSLNIVNSQAIAQLHAAGVSFVWLSPELSGRQIADLARESALPVGVAAFGRQELMVTEHCILMAAGACEQKCGVCQRRMRAWTLRDRKGYEFPVVTDVSGRSHVYNSVPLDLGSVLPELTAAGVSAIRLDLELDSPESVAHHTRSFRQLLGASTVGTVAARDKRSATTSGHYFRGVH